MRLRHLTLFVALFLSACLESETPVIPLAELAQPDDLAGVFWGQSLTGQSEPPAVVRFGRSDSGYLGAETAGAEEEPSRFRLLPIRPPDLFVMITDTGKNRSVYQVMERRALGVWQVAMIAPFGDGHLSATNLAYADRIARKHGLRLDGNDPDKTLIEGPVHGKAIPALFRDAAFLAALYAEPTQNYLPAPRWPAASVTGDDLLPPGEPPRGLTIEGADLVGAGWVQPGWVSGRYAEEAGGGAVSTVPIEVSPLPDGRFESRTGDRVVRFGVLPFDAARSLFLSVEEGEWYVGDVRHSGSSLQFLVRNGDGWVREPIYVRGTGSQVGRMDWTRAPMAAAAARVGLRLDGASLTGRVAAGALAGLLRDGGFTIGLSVADYGRVRMVRRP